MNIFFLDRDPKIAAQYLLDVHTGSANHGGKMIVESAQMLANCYTPEELMVAPKTKTGSVRRYSYFNHPCSKWVRESKANFDWLLTHALEMVKEKQFRGGPVHFTNEFLTWCVNNPPKNPLPDIGFTPPALAVKPEYLGVSYDPVEVYRSFYVGTKATNKTKKSMFSYTNREIPSFWNGRTK